MGLFGPSIATKEAAGDIGGLIDTFEELKPEEARGSGRGIGQYR